MIYQSGGFQGLHVWQKAHELTLDVYKILKHLPVSERYNLTDQLRRSTVSICANLAEGHRKSKKDFARFIAIFLGSLEETKYYLILARDLGYLSRELFESLFVRTEEVGKMLTGLRKSLC